MGRIRASPAIIVAAVALVAALAGTAIAGSDVQSSAINKKKVKKIATKQINELAPGLSVAHADSATNADNAASADSATNATSAETATSAESADNAAALGGVALADLNPADAGNDTDCSPDATGTECTPGATLTLNRTADVFVTVGATWYSDLSAGSNVQFGCDIRRNGTASITFGYDYGTASDDTTDGQGRAVHLADIDFTRPPGTYTYTLRCFENTGTVELDDVVVHAIALAN